MVPASRIGRETKGTRTLGLSRSEWCEQFKVTMRGPERKDAALELKEDGFSNRAIADVLGVGSKTIDRDVNASNDASTDLSPGEEVTNNASNDALESYQSEEKDASERERWCSSPVDPSSERIIRRRRR
jgi:hypothetical protein